MEWKETPETLNFCQQLTGFNKKVQRLEQTRFFNSPPVNFSLHRIPGKILSMTGSVDNNKKAFIELEVRMEVDHIELHHFDRDDIEAFVLTYRMLTQNNDRYSIVRLSKSYELAHQL
jgi:hypothetical protein